jgi:hypothetical protein
VDSTRRSVGWMEGGGGYSVAPTDLYGSILLNKIEIIHRLRRCIHNLRRVTSSCKFLGEETADLEYELNGAEKELAALIDDYMAAQIARYNRERNRPRR